MQSGKDDSESQVAEKLEKLAVKPCGDEDDSDCSDLDDYDDEDDDESEGDEEKWRSHQREPLYIHAVLWFE